MTILVAKQLYKELDEITKILAKPGKKIPKDIDISLFKDVYFTTKTLDGKGYYGSLIFLAVFHLNVDLLKELQDKFGFDPNVTDLICSATPLWMAVDSLIDLPDKKLCEHIIKALLKNPKTIPYLGRVLDKETPLRHLASNGDQHLEWVQILAGYEENFDTDIYGGNALVLAIQSQQYKTALRLLNTPQGQALVAVQRPDAAYPLDLCLQIPDANIGVLLIQAMLKEYDSNTIINKSMSLYTILSNPAPDCRLKYTEILLAHGANPNINAKGTESILTVIVYKFLKSKEQNESAGANNYFTLIKLVLDYKANIFCEDIYTGTTLIASLSKLQHGKIIIDLFKEYFKSNLSALGDIENYIAQAPEITPINTNFNKTNAASSLQTTNVSLFSQFAAEFEEMLQATLAPGNAEHRQNSSLMLYKRYTDLYPKDKDLSKIQGIIILQLIKLLHCGTLSSKNILVLIKHLKDKNNEFTMHLWWPYKEYLSKSLYETIDCKDKSRNLSNLFKHAANLANHFYTVDDEIFEYQKDVFNDLMQRIIRLALISADESQVNYGEFIDKLNKIPKNNLDLFEPETRLLILELKITHAYFKGNKHEYDELYACISKVLPNKHILFRQYDYWYVDLVFNEIAKNSPLDDKHTERLQKELDVFKKNYPMLKSTDLDQRLINLKEKVAQEKMERRKEKKYAKIEKNEKNKEERIVQNENIVNLSSVSKPQHVAPCLDSNEILSMVNASSSNSSSSSFVSKDNLLITSSFTTDNQDLFKPARKIRIRDGCQRFFQMTKKLATVVQHIYEVENLEKPAPLYQESDIRKIFAPALQLGEFIKPITCWGVDNVCWVVCRMPNEVLNHAGLADSFNMQFNTATELQPARSSGICCENKVYRLKLKGSDYRLHCTQVIRAPEERCFLVIFDTLWQHDKAFDYKADKYIFEFKNSYSFLSNAL